VRRIYGGDRSIWKKRGEKRKGSGREVDCTTQELESWWGAGPHRLRSREERGGEKERRALGRAKSRGGEKITTRRHGYQLNVRESGSEITDVWRIFSPKGLFFEAKRQGEHRNTGDEEKEK